MPVQRDRNGDETTRPAPFTTAQRPRNAPLVIVSERGRHSDESRRIVRAQAARASAAQSRVTRARNREGREVTGRDEAQSPMSSDEASQTLEPPNVDLGVAPGAGLIDRPLVTWLANSMNTTTTALLHSVSAIGTEPNLTAGIGAPLPVSSQAVSALSIPGSLTASESGRLQLPLALPRGFVALQQRVEISNNLTILLSRTSCFDFASPGVEERLYQLLRELIVGQVQAIVTPLVATGHPIQGHLRIACTCLTIFQGQRTDGGAFTQPRYQSGLEAAWSEATLLDQGSLAEPKSAEASLWAVFIINVTTGSTTEFFHQLLHRLLQDLGLRHWSDVRSTLLNFIYPVSFLDEPCKSFFEKLQQLQVGLS